MLEAGKISLLAGLMGAVALGCGDDDRGMPGAFTDSLGNVFRYDEESGLAPENPGEVIANCQGEDPVEFLVDWGDTGIAMICAKDPDGGGPVAETCRPVACETDYECPYEKDLLESGCIKDICQCVSGACPCYDGACPPPRVDGKVGDSELVALCLHDRPRPMTCPWAADPDLYPEVLFSAINACTDDDRCEVPAECLQP